MRSLIDELSSKSLAHQLTNCFERLRVDQVASVQFDEVNGKRLKEDLYSRIRIPRALGGDRDRQMHMIVVFMARDLVHVTEVTCSSRPVIDDSGQEVTCACRLYITGICVWPANEYSCDGCEPMRIAGGMVAVGRHQAAIGGRGSGFRGRQRATAVAVYRIDNGIGCSAARGSGASRHPPVNPVTRRPVIDHLYLAKSYCHIRRNLIITSSQNATPVYV